LVQVIHHALSIFLARLPILKHVQLGVEHAHRLIPVIKEVGVKQGGVVIGFVRADHVASRSTARGLGLVHVFDPSTSQERINVEGDVSGRKNIGVASLQEPVYHHAATLGGEPGVTRKFNVWNDAKSRHYGIGGI